MWREGGEEEGEEVLKEERKKGGRLRGNKNTNKEIWLMGKFKMAKGKVAVEEILE